jgi:hypothetical protein
MKRDILSEYGRDSRPGGNRASCGGVCVAKELPYDPPRGPTSQMQQSPGLNGTNHGMKGTQGRH